MASWEPVDIDPTDHDEIEEDDDKWGDGLMDDLERRFNELRQSNATLETSSDKDITLDRDKLKKDTIELVANQIYDKLTILFNNTRKRLGIQKGIPIVESIRNYDNFKLVDDGKISYVYKRTVIELGIIDEKLKSPSDIRKIGVTKLISMGFTNITDEDVQPYRVKYKKAREKVRIIK